MPSAKVPARLWANRRGAGAGESAMRPGRRDQRALYNASNGFHRGKAAHHHRSAARAKNTRGSCMRTPARSTSPIRRGWKTNAEY
jgi:hypothetical protein